MDIKYNSALPVVPDEALRQHALLLLQHLSRRTDGSDPRFVLWDKTDGAPIELTEELFELLRGILIDLSQNRAVQVLPWGMELSTFEAAEFLNVSRPHVIKLIEQNKLPCRKVGTHRRIRLDDLMRYKQDTEREAARVREQLTKEAQELNWGY